MEVVRGKIYCCCRRPGLVQYHSFSTASITSPESSRFGTAIPQCGGLVLLQIDTISSTYLNVFCYTVTKTNSNMLTQYLEGKSGISTGLRKYKRTYIKRFPLCLKAPECLLHW